MPVRRHTTKNDGRGLISIVSGELVWIHNDNTVAPDVVVPSEYAPAFAVDLPLAQHRMRLAALPFAIEDRIAQPLDELKVALGPEVAPQRYLASVVSATQLGDWQAILVRHGITSGRIIPDATTLPHPQGDARWSVMVEGNRVLVRTLEHEAFATSAALFAAHWSAAGGPVLQQVGDSWSPELPQPILQVVQAPVIARSGSVVDLRQALQQVGDQRFVAPLKIAAAIVATAALAHTAVLSIDAAFVTAGATHRQEEAERLLSSVAPLVPAGDDPGAILAGMLPNNSAQSVISRFLPLLSRASSSMKPVSEGVAIQALAFDAEDGALQLKIEASDLAALERVEKSLTEAGLDTQSGGATIGEGRAESSITVRDGTGANFEGNAS